MFIALQTAKDHASTKLVLDLDIRLMTVYACGAVRRTPDVGRGAVERSDAITGPRHSSLPLLPPPRFGPLRGLTGFSIPQMARLPVELLEIIVRDYYDSTYAATPPMAASATYVSARHYSYAKPAWADIAPLLNASRIIRKLAMQIWLSTLVAIPPSGRVGLSAVYAFPYPRFAHWVR
jgi:hypothetical protein